MNNYNNNLIDKLPHHLKQYIVEQHYEHYTAVDHAVWRYVMRQNYRYLKDVAYYPYIPGLKKAGLTIEHIPDLQTMNDHLKQIGWGAVTVNGFIPSQAFMEFQAYRVLIVAADIRQIEHIEYTPAPDIIHESAGHAPIIGEREYAAYLQFTGEVGTRAMLSKKDQELFEAIRKLAVLKELAGTTERAIKTAEEELCHIQQNMGEPSEMALLARLHWWTVEYGLIGTLEDHKIYGAGLLSSIGESVTCMQPEVKKLLYTIDAVNYPYDITKPQPQLFVTPDFQNLVQVLDTFADALSYRKGGSESIQKAIDCGLVCTAVYSSGLQVSGIFEATGAEAGAYLQTNGPTALAVDDKELSGHSKQVHQKGFGSPIGKLKDYDLPLEAFTIEGLKNIGVEKEKNAVLRFQSGIEVSGRVVDLLIYDEIPVLISFVDCTVTNTVTGKRLFEPEWGRYDMAVGEKIVSVFSGAADKDAYEQITIVPKEMPRSQYTKKTLRLHALYQQVRAIREGNENENLIGTIWQELQLKYDDDWLCPMELLEILKDRSIHVEMQREIEAHLQELKISHIELSKLIEDGLHTLGHIELLPGR
ncbi:MAG: aromatic amino acid hydroxylase [Niabella sp.]|nr:aromatic amino acid hydroxylase [Niabella sp.]